MIYLNAFLIACVAVFIVDVSGFTQSWKTALGKWLGCRIGSAKPFDCSLCTTWWATLIYFAVTGNLTIPAVAFSALLAYLAFPLSQLMNGLRELILFIINKLTNVWN